MDDEELAALAGFTVAFFKSDPGLWKVFQQAKKEDWSGQRLLAAARNTSWFKKHSEAERQAQLLRTSDPAEYKRRLAATRAQVKAIADSTGLGARAALLKQVGRLAFLHGWNEQQITKQLAGVSNYGQGLRRDDIQTKGKVGQAERFIRQLTRDYGHAVTRGTMATFARRFAMGQIDENYIRDHFITKAKSKFPGIAHELESGRTLRDIADPYIDSMARLWEVNPDTIDLRKDKTIHRALQGRDEKGAPKTLELWEFEQSLREDPRWNRTNNAREETFTVGHKALKDMGLVI